MKNASNAKTWYSGFHKGASIYDVRSGRGSPKSRQKEQNQLISVCYKGERWSKNPKILRTSIWETPNGFSQGFRKTLAPRLRENRAHFPFDPPLPNKHMCKKTSKRTVFLFSLWDIFKAIICSCLSICIFVDWDSMRLF